MSRHSVFSACSVGVLMAALGCADDGAAGPSSPPPASLLDTAAIEAPPPAAKVNAVDLLLVVDNSGSMASEQERLGARIAHLAEVLTTGDRMHGTPPGDPADATRYFPPVASLHVGVVSTNMGGLDSPLGGPAIESCDGLGDDGVLQQSTRVAEEGVIASTEREFEGYITGDVVLAPDPSCTLGELSPYQAFVAGSTPVADFAQRVRCAARLGVRGCPFEQPLEAMWKALAPSQGTGELHTFLDGTRGHGDTLHAGFLREEALLAVVLVTDEEDCSITQQGKALFDVERGGESEARFGSALNLRCGRNAHDATLVRPIERYVDGLKSLKPGHPERVVFAAIAGIPQTLGPGLGLDEVLALPQMQFQEEGNTELPAPSCLRQDPGTGRIDKAAPPRRLLEVAKAFGDNAVVHSICADDYTPALDGVIECLAAQM